MKSQNASNLDVLPSHTLGGVGRDSKGIEAKAVVDIASGNSSVAQRGENLILGSSNGGAATERNSSRVLSRNRAGHEARGTRAGVGPVTKAAARSGRGVHEGAQRGASRLVGRVCLGETQSSTGVDVDFLSTRDLDILVEVLVISGL